MVKLSNTRGLTNKEVDVMSALLIEAAQENLGMASVFAIMQTAQDWMENKAGLQLGAHSYSQPHVVPLLLLQRIGAINVTVPWDTPPESHTPSMMKETFSFNRTCSCR